MRRYKLIIACLIIFCFCTVNLFAAKTEKQVEKELKIIQDAINESGAEWIAGKTPQAYLSKEEQKRLAGIKESIPMPRDDAAVEFLRSTSETPPAEWDWRDVDGHNWVTPIRDQGACGSCVAFGVCAALEASFNIFLADTTTTFSLNLSEQHLFSCGTDEDNFLYGYNLFSCIDGWHNVGTCPNGEAIGGMEYAFKYGIPDEECSPYLAVDNNCEDTCDNWKDRVYKINSYYIVASDGQTLESIEDIKLAVMKHPVATEMDIYSDFYYYIDEIYERSSEADYLGGHAVCIIGWDDDRRYWICKNSWGTNWGDEGFFRIRWKDSGIGRNTVDACTCIYPSPESSPVVSNVKVEQKADDPRFVKITYDLQNSGEDFSTVKSTLSKDGGTTYNFKISSVSGDINDYVAPGNSKKITWNAFKDYPGEKISEASVRIQAGLQSRGLRIENISSIYSEPYLLDFNFTLRDHTGEAVVADPSRFTYTCKEDRDTISFSETGTRLEGAESKQMKCFLVMDYTLSIADKEFYGDSDGDGKSDAIEAMEESSKNFIDDQKDDAQIGIIEFHREDQLPRIVGGLSLNKSDLKRRIDSIWSDYVHGVPAASRCWDGVHSALSQFRPEYPYDDLRFVIFLSDGRDESSYYQPADIIDLALERSARIYCIGFGEEVNPVKLKEITEKTSGIYYEAQSVEEMEDRFNRIMRDVKGQYTLRWATLKRADRNFVPSFRIEAAKCYHVYKSDSYNPVNFGADILNGVLRFIGSPVVDGKTTIFLRSGYTPRYIRRIRLYIKTRFPYTVEMIPEQGGGLCPDGWKLEMIDDPDNANARWIEIISPDPDDTSTSLKYADFGPILRFNFSGLNSLSDLFIGTGELAQVDSSIYENGQSYSLYIDWETSK
jgi:C1A family cysteine protease